MSVVLSFLSVTCRKSLRPRQRPWPRHAWALCLGYACGLLSATAAAQQPAPPPAGLNAVTTPAAAVSTPTPTATRVPTPTPTQAPGPSEAAGERVLVVLDEKTLSRAALEKQLEDLKGAPLPPLPTVPLSDLGLTACLVRLKGAEARRAMLRQIPGVQGVFTPRRSSAGGREVVFEPGLVLVQLDDAAGEAQVQALKDQARAIGLVHVRALRTEPAKVHKFRLDPLDGDLAAALRAVRGLAGVIHAEADGLLFSAPP